MYPQFFLICSLFNISAFHFAPAPTSKFSSSHVQTGSRSLRYLYVVFLFPPAKPLGDHQSTETRVKKSNHLSKHFYEGVFHLLKNWKVMKTTNGKYHVWKDENSLWRWLGIFGEHYHRYLKKKKIDGQYKRLKFNREIQHRDIEDTSRLTKPRRRGGVADGASGFRCEARLGDSSSGLVILLFT